MGEGIRVVVILNEANPELLQALSSIPARARAERLRILATLGLQVAGKSASLAPPRAVESRVNKGGGSDRSLSAGPAPARNTTNAVEISGPMQQREERAPKEKEKGEDSPPRGKSILAGFVKSLG